MGVLQCDGRFVAPFRYAAVGVDVDEIEGGAVPVLGDVRVGEFVSAAWRCGVSIVVSGYGVVQGGM